MSKVYDDPKYNAAFDRCVDVMARLLQKYGPQLLGQMQETEKDGRTQSAASGKQPVPVYQEFDKAARYKLNLHVAYLFGVCYNKYATCIFALWGK